MLTSLRAQNKELGERLKVVEQRAEFLEEENRTLKLKLKALQIQSDLSQNNTNLNKQTRTIGEEDNTTNSSVLEFTTPLLKSTPRYAKSTLCCNLLGILSRK